MSIKPLEVQRDEDGYWTHPDYFVPANGNEYGVPGEFSTWLRQHNLESFTLSLESDDAASEVAEKYFDGGFGCDISLWQPIQARRQRLVCRLHSRYRGRPLLHLASPCNVRWPLVNVP